MSNKDAAEPLKQDSKEAKNRFKTALDEEKRDLKTRNALYHQVNAYERSRKKDERKAPQGVFVSAQHLTKIYSNRLRAVNDFSIDIQSGEFIVLVGPSGCGKSTTLRMIAGLEDITSGDLFIDGEYANDLEPLERQVAMVFQSYALYPHMSVYENMSFGLSSIRIKERALSKEGVPAVDENGKPVFIRRKLTKEEIDGRIQAAASTLQIKEFLNRKPTELSGGQCQRVALGRAIVRNAKIFLLDEPLSNLDAKLRVEMRSELVKLHEHLRNTMIYVTHDQTEAMTMATRIVVLAKGEIQQIGTPHEVYDKPANVFVATFMGSPTMNITHAVYDGGTLHFHDGSALELTDEQKRKHDAYFRMAAKNEQTRIEIDNEKLSRLRRGEKLNELPFDYEGEIKNAKDCLASDQITLENKPHDVIFGIRPEDMSFSSAATEGYSCEIEVSELLGSEFSLHMQLFGQEFIALTPSTIPLSRGDKGKLNFKTERVHLFDSTSKNLIF